MIGSGPLRVSPADCNIMFAARAGGRGKRKNRKEEGEGGGVERSFMAMAASHHHPLLLSSSFLALPHLTPTTFAPLLHHPHPHSNHLSPPLRLSISSSSSSSSDHTFNSPPHASSSPGRRQLLASSSSCFLPFLSLSSAAEADVSGLPGPLNKYIKRKKLDPLDTYVPAVILSQSQFQDLEVKLESDKPEYADARSLLRSGPVSSLRTDIRAVAQYASEAGEGKEAFDAVDQCISALEDLDSLLLRATRNDISASLKTMKTKIDAALVALDRLLATVPTPILERCKAIAAAYRETTITSVQSEQLDSDTKSLESLL